MAKWTANTVYCYRVAETMMEDRIGGIGAQADSNGRINAKDLKPEELELLRLFSESQNAWQQVCLTLSTCPLSVSLSLSLLSLSLSLSLSLHALTLTPTPTLTPALTLTLTLALTLTPALTPTLTLAPAPTLTPALTLPLGAPVSAEVSVSTDAGVTWASPGALFTRYA